MESRFDRGKNKTVRHSQWQKLGRIYCPSGDRPWARSHAANPTAEHLQDDFYRVYFSARDENNRSSIAYIVIDINRPQEILEEASEPVLRPGELGMFDDCGASIGCILGIGQKRFLYYMGWNLAVTVPWKNAIGLAISESPDQPFKRYSRFPIVPLDEEDPFTVSYPWVMYDENRYRMWYGSNLKWGADKNDMLHVIKYAESTDGINWQKTSHIAIDSLSSEEYAICKPCVLKQNDSYLMWFCSRGDKYRIQRASSADGVIWKRLGQESGIDVSESGWDSDMIEYPCVFEHKGCRYLLYCGNDYGKSGFGLARLQTD